MKKLIILIVCLASVLSAHGQASPPSTYSPQLVTYQGIPFGVCSVYQIAENVLNGSYYTCNISTHLWQSVSSTTLTTAAADCNAADGALLSLTNSNSGPTSYIQKCQNGDLAISVDGQLIPIRGYLRWTNGDIDLRAGAGGTALYCNTAANVGITLPAGSCQFSMPLSGVGTAKLDFFSGSPTNNDMWWDAGTGCSTWHVNNSLTKGATLCPPASSNNTTVVTGNTCGTVSANGACSNASPTNYHCVSGSAVLSSGASTITGIAPAFSDTTFIVLTNDATTKTNASSGAAASGSSITFSGTGTDTLNFVACGG